MEDEAQQELKLRVVGVSEIVGGCGISLLVLSDEARQRVMTVVCEQTTGREIALRMAGAPGLSRRLPETLCTMLPFLNGESYELRVYDVYGGEYKCALTHRYDFSKVPIRMSDGVLLALVAGLDIVISRQLFMRQSIAYDKESHSMAIPINVLSKTMLEHALEKAIDDENYEMASVLRDELKKRTDSETATLDATSDISDMLE